MKKHYYSIISQFAKELVSLSSIQTPPRKRTILKPITVSSQQSAAAKLIKRGEYQEAVCLIDNIIRTFPLKKKTMVKLMLMKAAASDRQIAYVTLSNIIREVDPECSDAYFRRSLLRFSLEDAILDLDKAISLNPKQSDYWIARARMRIKMEDMENADLDIEEALRLRPRHPMVYNLRTKWHLDSYSIFEAISIMKMCREMCFDWMRNSPCPLRNLGNTCYMSSILQALFASPLANYFISGVYKIDSPRYGKVSQMFADLTNNVFTQDICDPMELRTEFIALTPTFKGHVQQDASEFLSFLLERLHIDLRREQNNSLSINSSMTEFEQIRNSVRASECSIIDDLFQGWTKTHTNCTHCGINHNVYERFRFVSLYINGSESPTLSSLLNEVSRNVQTLCSCNHQQNRITTFFKSPKILCIVLQRFNPTSGKDIQFVECPLTIKLPLDESPELDVIEEIDIEKEEEEEENFIYSLFAIIEHKGKTSNGGHYIATVKHNEVWYKYDDSQQRELSAPSINNDAYVLFYI